jgi:transcriptional regulator with XRE-family HTH domain
MIERRRHMANLKLKELRKEHKLTQEQISILLNVKQNTYSQYENGVREPDIDNLIKLADIFKVSIDYLVGRYSKN